MRYSQILGGVGGLITGAGIAYFLPAILPAVGLVKLASIVVGSGIAGSFVAGETAKCTSHRVGQFVGDQVKKAGSGDVVANYVASGIEQSLEDLDMGVNHNHGTSSGLLWAAKKFSRYDDQFIKDTVEGTLKDKARICCPQFMRKKLGEMACNGTDTVGTTVIGNTVTPILEGAVKFVEIAAKSADLYNKMMKND